MEDLTASADEAEDEALKARRKLGMPEYDPDEGLTSALPKLMLPD